MQYLLIIAEEEGVRDTWSKDDQAADMQRWLDYTAELAQSGAYVDGKALHPSSTATTVRVQHGDTLMTDGPFAETKEVVNGYYLIDVSDVDEAIGWAAKIPTLGAVEVRPVIDMDAFSEGQPQGG